MGERLFYVDTCIWLNFFKKEGDAAKGKPYWEIAKDFIEEIIFSDDKKIFYSGFILKELKFKLNEKLFKEKYLFMKKEFKFVKAILEDYSFARKLESESSYEISFFDCLHIALCKRLNFILITRDVELMKFAKRYIKADKPENLIS